MWQQWVNVLLGLWIIAVPFLGLATGSLMWALVLTGIAIAILALWSAGEESSQAGILHRRQHQH